MANADEFDDTDFEDGDDSGLEIDDLDEDLGGSLNEDEDDIAETDLDDIDLDTDDEDNEAEDADEVDEVDEDDEDVEDAELEGGDETPAEDDDEEDVTDLEDEEDDEETEQSLDAILGSDDAAGDKKKRRRKATATFDETTNPAGEGEFTCRSCFLVKRRAQLADADQLICVDCA